MQGTVYALLYTLLYTYFEGDGGTIQRVFQVSPNYSS